MVRGGLSSEAAAGLGALGGVPPRWFNVDVLAVDRRPARTLWGGVLSRLWVCLPPLLRTPVPGVHRPMTSRPHSPTPHIPHALIRQPFDWGQLSLAFISHADTHFQREALQIPFAILSLPNLLCCFLQ